MTGKGGDIKVNDTAKLVCGPIQAQNARIYMIDTVLDPNSPPEALVPTVSGDQHHDHDEGPGSHPGCRRADRLISSARADTKLPLFT